MFLWPRIAVVIPTRNRSGFLAKALASVADQTEKVAEVVVVDDASTDETAALVRNLAAKGMPITYIRNAEPLGGSGARNKGVAAARGDYVAFLDDDDDWLPEKIERQADLIEGTGCEVVTCGWHFAGQPGDRGIRRYFIPPAVITYRSNLPQCLMGGCSGVIVKRSIFEDVGGFDESLPCLQDYDLWQRILVRFPAQAATEVLYNYQVNDDIVRITNNRDAQLQGVNRFYEKHCWMMTPAQKRYFQSKPLELRYIFERNPWKKYLYLWGALLGAPKSRIKWFVGQHLRFIGPIHVR